MGVEQQQPPVHGGRSRSRVASSAAREVGVTQAMETLVLSSSSSDTGSTGESSSNKTGSGNGNGNGKAAAGNGGDAEPSAGRGAKRGRPVDQPAVLRTIPEALATKQGKVGTKLKLKSNYFALEKVPNWSLFQYRVDMSPEIDYTKERKYHVRQNPLIKNYIFDGTMMMTTTPLGDKSDKLVFTSKRKHDDELVTVTIRYVGEIDPSSNTYIQFLNIIVRMLLEKLNLDLIGRNYYDAKAAIKTKELKQYSLELYPGYTTSIRQHENDILLNVDISHKILRTDSVYDMIKKDLSRAGANRDTVKDRLDKCLLGQIVITKYNNKTYKISEVRLDMSPSDEFENKKGEKVKFSDYYLQRWGMKITDLNQPMIVSIPKEKDKMGKVQAPIQLVPELCNMTGLSEEQRSNFSLMKDLGVYTRQGPDKKAEGLKKFAERINNAPEIAEMLKEWDMSFAQKLQELPGREFAPEDITGGKSCKASYKASNADWGKSFRNWTCLSVIDISKWVVICINKDKTTTDAFVDSLMKTFPCVGMTVKAPKVVCIADSRAGTYAAKIDELIEKKPSMMMIVIPNNKNPDLYSVIKKKLCIEAPIPSQVVTTKVIEKPKGLMSVAMKVALQINCKMGGQLWAVKIPMKKSMVVGFDAYHDSQQQGKSVGALVASLNDTFTKYFSCTELHPTYGATEISNTISSMMTRALKSYEKANKCFPEKVFFYRDGVGEGQISFVYEHEVKQLKAALKSLSPNINLTFIITSKRINTRFTTAGTHADNPNSGTVVDDVVTLPERYDFFLVSQSVTQGTVNPTSYNVLCDDSGMKPDHLQQLSYKLTHLYYNWPGTVRVPAPVQYAHKLAFLVGTSLHTPPSTELEELLYYL